MYGLPVSAALLTVRPPLASNEKAGAASPY
jgi:hypothetical protein